MRNNNPLNIRIGNQWIGERSVNTDGEFEQFVSLEYGLRAGLKLISRYINHYRLYTIEKIIRRWAPYTENATLGYIGVVVYLTRIKKDEPLFFENEMQMIKLVYAMSYVENGVCLDAKVIQKAYQMLTEERIVSEAFA